MRKISIGFKSVLFFPIIGLLYLLIGTRRRNLIQSDAGKWSEWKKGPYGFTGLIYLFAVYKEFRSLYYYRVGPAGNLFSGIIKGESCLYLRCPKIGAGFLVQHGFSTIINADSIGENCKEFQQVTIGYNGDRRPTIGDNVMICAGAKVLGGITIGSNVIIGANAVVVHDVPDGSVVCGVPAKVIGRVAFVDNLK